MAKKLTFDTPNQKGMNFIRKKKSFRRIIGFDNEYEYIKLKESYFEKFIEKTTITDVVIQELVNDLRNAKIEYKLQPRNRRLAFFHLLKWHYLAYNKYGYFTISSHFQTECFRLPIKVTAVNSYCLIDKMFRFNVIHFLTKKVLLEKKDYVK